MLSSVVRRREPSRMEASVKKLSWWLLVLLLCYPLGYATFVVTSEVADSVTAKESENLLTRIRSGMAPAEVEAVIGRSLEYTVPYARVGDDEQFSHNWTIRGYRLEVIFVNGRSAQWHTFEPEPSPVRRLFGWVFFWWLAPFVED
jgi:hypothetical protein